MQSQPLPSESDRFLTDRERDIARRVRRSLHLPSTMTEEAVAQQFRGSVAWRRARMKRTAEELWEGLRIAIRPVQARLRDRMQPLVRRIVLLWKRLWR